MQLNSSQLKSTQKTKLITNGHIFMQKDAFKY